MKIDLQFAQFFHEYSVDLSNRVIYMGSAGDHEGAEGGVDYKMADRAIKNLLLLDSASDSPINVILNSPGGDTYHGFAIYDAIKSCRSFVRITGVGYVMSMGSIIMQAGDERVMLPNSKMMLHYGSMEIGGVVKDVINWVEAEKKEMRAVEDIYLKKIKEKNPKFPRTALQNKMRHDCILTADEALDLGLINKIGDFS